MGACLVGALACDGPTSDYPNRNTGGPGQNGSDDSSSNPHGPFTLDASVGIPTRAADSGCAPQARELPYDDDVVPDGGVDQGDASVLPSRQTTLQPGFDAGCATR